MRNLTVVPRVLKAIITKEFGKGKYSFQLLAVWERALPPPPAAHQAVKVSVCMNRMAIPNVVLRWLKTNPHEQCTTWYADQTFFRRGQICVEIFLKQIWNTLAETR